MTPARVRGIRRAVLDWARTVDRPLPWRGERDPYRVLVSEVMLQQTQASRVPAAYERFLDAFGSLADLASASRGDVLRAWGGLGYNRRAVHLHEAARRILECGAFPRTVGELESLPGVGPYTARAVASFAFGADAACVDANVRRILTRLEGLPRDADVQTLADRLCPLGDAARWNQALMDFGAVHCRPRDPRCGNCPLRRRCSWAKGDRGPEAPTPSRRPFRETNRYARGRVVAALREVSVATDAELAVCTGLERARLSHALHTLERDGIVTRSMDGLRLG